MVCPSPLDLLSTISAKPGHQRRAGGVHAERGARRLNHPRGGGVAGDCEGDHDVDCRVGEDAVVLPRRIATCEGDSVYVLIGNELAAGHHTPRFDFDERSHEMGIELLAGVGQNLKKCGRYG